MEVLRKRGSLIKELLALAFDLVLINGIVVNHEGVAERDIAVSGGRIAALGQFQAGQGEQSIDCRGLHILPGVIDTQVHFREPGP
jgi:dihydroorotase